MNFKDTLLMPKTDFPMRGGLPLIRASNSKNGMQKINIKSIRKIKVINLISCMMVHHMQMVVTYGTCT